MAKFSKVSTPTISRFENGEKDIQLSSVLGILGVLGMVDERRLDFFSNKSAKYPFEGREVVRFFGHDGDKQVICEISREALADHFGGDTKTPEKAFEENHVAIEQEARRQYLNGKINEKGIVFISTMDL